MASRKELEDALKTGHHVRVRGRTETVRHARTLPPDVPDAPVEGTVTRTPDGRLTHEGMLLALQEGGAVLHMGEVLDKADQLPAPEEVAAGDEQRVAALSNDIDAQIAALQVRQEKLKGLRGKGGARDAPPPWTPPGAQDTQVVAAPPPPPETPEEDEGRRGRRHKKEE
jgi:hypothetical protein